MPLSLKQHHLFSTMSFHQHPASFPNIVDQSDMLPYHLEEVGRENDLEDLDIFYSSPPSSSYMESTIPFDTASLLSIGDPYISLNNQTNQWVSPPQDGPVLYQGHGLGTNLFPQSNTTLPHRSSAMTSTASTSMATSYSGLDSLATTTNNYPSSSSSSSTFPVQHQSPPQTQTQSTKDLNNYGTPNGDGTWRCAYPGCSSSAVFRRGCDLRKHFNRHRKYLFCRTEGCPQSVQGGFSSKKDRDRHEAKHNPGVMCEWKDCDRKFSRVDNMKDHVRRIHRRSLDGDR